MEPTTRSTAPVPVVLPAHDVVVSLGAQEHGFDRLVEWVEAWLVRRPEVSCLLQHGFSRPSPLARSVRRVPRPQLLEQYRQASAVVVQGGPSSIADARGLGIRPLAVPRRPALGEHRDDHQAAVTDLMAQAGEVVRPDSAEELAVLLDLALARPALFRDGPVPHRAAPERRERPRIAV